MFKREKARQGKDLCKKEACAIQKCLRGMDYSSVHLFHQFYKYTPLTVRDIFSKSVLDIRTRLVATVKPETKWMPNSDSALKLVPKCNILCYDLLNYFYSCLKIAVF